MWNYTVHPHALHMQLDVCVFGCCVLFNLISCTPTHPPSADPSPFFLSCAGSCEVLNADTLETVVSLHHRKEEISDVKFSPSTYLTNMDTHPKASTSCTYSICEYAILLLSWEVPGCGFT